MIFIHKTNICIVGLLLLSACSPTSGLDKSMKFDKLNWTTKDDMDYPMRDAMLNDLVSHHYLKGLTYKQLIDTLGEPANYGNDKDSVYYDVVVNYGYLDPKSGKYLALHIDKDSVVTGFKVVEWKNRHANEN